ncbi:hypothetical protein C8Q70DRAFT_559967 [Cubamyces menziesii]|nr:hypothetical protein C8Q70DRAFT_559967 [Cubamyces menziesii]
MSTLVEPVPAPIANALAQVPLVEDTYALRVEEEDLKFMRAQTGITDDIELKRHILQVQAEAYRVFPYPCIRRFVFVRSTLPRIPGYDRLLKLGREHKGAILLDIGCCFGNDVRHAAADGFPVKQIVASDLHAEYWELGHKLFRTTNETFPAKFIPGDVFDPAHIEVVPPTYCPATDATPDLPTSTSLNPLHGRVSAIHASAFFHLFNEEKQLHIARALAGLLSAEPGSMIIGLHAIAMEKGITVEHFGEGGAVSDITVFYHSPESWVELWDGQVFKKGSVKVETSLTERDLAGRMIPFLHWCVIRL